MEPLKKSNAKNNMPLLLILLIITVCEVSAQSRETDVLKTIIEASKSGASIVVDHDDSTKVERRDSDDVVNILDSFIPYLRESERKRSALAKVVFESSDAAEKSVGSLVSVVRRLEVKNPFLVVTPHVNGNGYVPVDGGLLSEVMGRPVRVTSGYGWRESFHRVHHGIDVACCVGDTVYALYDGVVERVGDEPNGYGRYVVVVHEDGLETRYAHLLNSLVHPEQVVVKGQPIALSGNSGNSTGPHLHFEMRRFGKPFNPYSLIGDSGWRRKSFIPDSRNGSFQSSHRNVYSFRRRRIAEQDYSSRICFPRLSAKSRLALKNREYCFESRYFC